MRRLFATAVPLGALIALAGCQPSAQSPDAPAAPSSGSNASASASASVAAPAATGGADWAAWRGPNADGISPEKIGNKDWKSKQPAQLWKFDMRDNGWAGPSVSGGKVFIVDHDGDNDVVRAIGLSSGKEVWNYPYAEKIGNDNGFCRATPVVDGGKVYTLSRMGVLNCLDAGSGKPVWTKDLTRDFGGKAPQWGYAMCPLVDGDRLIILPGAPSGTVAALDKATGATVWQGGGSDVAGYATPVKATINGAKQYVVFTAKNITGVDAASGRQLWYYPWQTSYDVNAATPLVIGNSVFITTGYGRGCALIDVTPGGTRARWENKEIQSHFSSPVYQDGRIYGTTDPGDLVCLDANSGRALWRQNGFEKGGLAAVDGTVIAINGGGGDIIMAKMSPDRYEELGRFNPLGGQTWTAPIVAQKRLIARNKQSLACFSLE